MASRMLIPETSRFYFITFTCQNWLPLIEMTSCYDGIYKWFDYLKTNGHYINSYVILPNHLHLLAAFRKGNRSINISISNGKRFLAYEIVKRLKQLQAGQTLLQLSRAVSISDAKKGKLHQVFEPSFDAKHCFNESFLRQKLTYIHNNPCRGKWNLATSPINYLHSSALFY